MSKSKLTPLDWWMIGGAVVAVAVAIGIAWGSRGGGAEGELCEAEATFVVTDVEKAWIDRYGLPVEAGEAVRSENGTTKLGTVASVERRPCLRVTVRDGEGTWEAHPNVEELVITVRMKLTDRGADGLRAGDLRMAAGSTGRYRFGGFLARAELAQLREVAGA